MLAAGDDGDNDPDDDDGDDENDDDGGEGLRRPLFECMNGDSRWPQTDNREYYD